MSVELMIRILNHPKAARGAEEDVDPELWEKDALRASAEEAEQEAAKRRTHRLPASRVEKMTLKNVCRNAFIKGGHLEGKLKRVHASFDNNMP